MDRTGVGSAPNLSITDNLIMKAYRQPPVGKGWSIDGHAARTHASEPQRRIRHYRPVDRYPFAFALRRELAAGHPGPGDIQRADGHRRRPTHPRAGRRELSRGSTGFCWSNATAGAAILLISEELDELFSLSDRIAVIYEGEIMGIVEDQDQEAIGLMMAGQRMGA